ncbi:phosphotriesterase family protein [Microcella pacifica]|uniref:Phosphotriesterase-related protein n=1 Tax=Microcella pacifica TaxID=2591847 RepID=A0A9E5JP64_9MICO|nr:hypothetical protein [Microcella pacifica]NHF62332.1 hypothetical protein [Microcella pacifica]
MKGAIRTVLGDRFAIEGVAYMHEHLILDSPLIADRFPHIHLHDVVAAVAEVARCRVAGATLVLEAMPMSAGRDVVRLAEVARRAEVDIVAATGLHHDRYYGPRHWTNFVSIDELADLFVADLVDGIDAFDYTGPIVRRTSHRAGVVKVATSGSSLDDRDRRNLQAVGQASVRTGAPVLTHCEEGKGGLEQVARLTELGVPASAIVLSHVDKSDDPGYLVALAESGAVLEFDQSLREWEAGVNSRTVRSTLLLLEHGFASSIVLGTDGARRTLWHELGGAPGLAWLASHLPSVLRAAGVGDDDLDLLLRGNAERVLRWRTVHASGSG